MTKTFKLGTTGRTGGKVKGWNWTCDLYTTVKNHRPEDREELTRLINEAFFKAVIQSKDADNSISGMTKDQAKTRSGQKKISHWRYVSNKYDCLKHALEVIQSDNPNNI